MRLLLVFLASLVSSFSLIAEELDRSDPYEMAVGVAEISFERLKRDKDLINQDPNHLKTVVEQELLPYTNYRYAALKVLGPEAKNNPRADVLAFIDAFRDYLVASYAQVLTQYDEQQIQFGPAPRLSESDRIAGVAVTIIDTPNPNIRLEFKLRKEKDGSWAAFDIIAEGVSLLSSKQSEWRGELRRKGLSSVTQELQRLAQLPIKKTDGN